MIQGYLVGPVFVGFTREMSGRCHECTSCRLDSSSVWARSGHMKLDVRKAERRCWRHCPCRLYTSSPREVDDSPPSTSLPPPPPLHLHRYTVLSYCKQTTTDYAEGYSTLTGWYPLPCSSNLWIPGGWHWHSPSLFRLRPFKIQLKTKLPVWTEEGVPLTISTGSLLLFANAN